MTEHNPFRYFKTSPEIIRLTVPVTEFIRRPDWLPVDLFPIRVRAAVLLIVLRIFHGFSVAGGLSPFLSFQDGDL